MVYGSNVRYPLVGHTLSNKPLFKYVSPISGSHSLEDTCIMHNVHQMAIYTQARLQLHLSLCNVLVNVIKGQMHNAERQVKYYTQLTKYAAFYKYPHHPVGHHAL